VSEKMQRRGAMAYGIGSMTASIAISRRLSASRNNWAWHHGAAKKKNISNSNVAKLRHGHGGINNRNREAA